MSSDYRSGHLKSAAHLIDVHAVLLDLDGTLIDSMGIYFELVELVFSRLQLPAVSRNQVVEALKGGFFDWDAVLPEMHAVQKSRLISRAWNIIDDVAPAMFDTQARLVAGTVPTLKDLAQKGIKIGVVTSTSAKYIEKKLALLEAAGCRQHLQAVITADDVKNRKPSPEPLLAASARLHTPAELCVYVGDMRTDILAGHAAGMQTVAVLTGLDDRDDLSAVGPNAVIASIADLPQLIAMDGRNPKLKSQPAPTHRR